MVQKSSASRTVSNPNARIRFNVSEAVCFCQIHDFELFVKPEATIQGWDIEINFAQIGERLGKLDNRLQQVIGNPSSCFFYNAVCREVEVSGKKYAETVQWDQFERLRPG
jgi:hypothetical protein